MSQLAPVSILKKAVQTAWSERRDLGLIAAIPLVALALNVAALQVMQVAALFQLGVDLPDSPSISGAHDLATRLLQEHAGFFTIAVIFIFIGFVIVSIFACAWHFRILRPNTAKTVREALTWDPAKGRFVLMAILLGLIEMVVQFVTLQVAGLVGVTLLSLLGTGSIVLLPILGLLPSGFAIYVLLRLSMVLPAAAVGDNLSLQDSWRLTKGNGLRLLGLAALALIGMILAMVAVFVPVSVIFSLLAFIAPGLLTMMFLMLLMMSGVFILGTAIWVTAVSIVYRQLSNPASGQA